MELTSLNQAKDEVFGPVGTPERDRYEQELAEEIRAHRIDIARYDITEAENIIKSEAAYQAALRRVEQLEELVDDDNPVMDDNAMELDMLIDMIEEYEDVHYPIGKPR